SRSRVKVRTTTRNERPFRPNAGATPSRAIRRPAAAGPTIRAALRAAEVRDTALRTSAFPTIAVTKAWRAGRARGVASPATAARGRSAMDQEAPGPVGRGRARSRAWRAKTSWVATRTRRRGKRSTSVPDTSERSRNGPNWRVPRSPSRNGELVSSRTSQACATDCIQEPNWEMIWAPRNWRKSRWLRARRLGGNVTGRLASSRPARGPWRSALPPEDGLGAGAARAPARWLGLRPPPPMILGRRRTRRELLPASLGAVGAWKADGAVRG